MLNESCRHFRDRFAPGSSDPHRERCEDCAAYAELLEDVRLSSSGATTATAATRPIPHALRQRLRQIPRREVLCRDIDRLYRAARSQTRKGEETPRDPAERHLAECPRCGEVYATLSTAFAVRRLPLPRRLASDLSAIVRHPQRLMPIWIADTRYAAAACYLLAALTLSLAGDATALFRETTATVSSRAQEWVDEGEARGLETWDATKTTFGQGIHDGWDRATRYAAASEKLITDTFTKITNSTQELIPGRNQPVEGDQDGTSRNNRQ